MPSWARPAKALLLPPLLVAGACGLMALPKGEASSSDSKGPDIVNSEINVNVNVDQIDAKGKNVNVGNIDSGSSGRISNVKISTSIDAKSINAKNNAEVGNVSFSNSNAVKHGISASKEEQTDRIGNVNIQSSSVKEVETVIGGSMTEKIKERNKSKSLEDSDGVDGRGVKHVFVGRDDIKEAEASQKHGQGLALGNTTVKDDDVKKVKTFVESAGKVLGGKSSRKQSSQDSEEE